MKRLIYILLILIILSFSGYVTAEHFWKGKALTLDQIKSRWGDMPFDESKFKSGDYSIRAKMAYSLIKNKKYIGKPLQDVETNLGRHDGFYFSDFIPAYLISVSKKTGDDVWQVVFLPGLNKKVDEVVVNKNCCD